jgi:threonine dehydrogenase-like Zn-dependent dehydrogenase
MHSVIFDGQVKVVDTPKPKASGCECLIRLLKAGICNTDVEITRGYMNFRGVLGHEFVGIVEESEHPMWIGRRVVGEINAGCGECEYCRNKLRRHCPHRSVLGILNRDGAFREYFTLPEENLHWVSDSISTDDAIFVEPVAAVCEILDQIKILPTAKVAVIGDGKLGLLIAMVLGLQPIHLTLIGKHPHKMKLVEGPNIETMELAEVGTLSRNFEVVIDASGSPEGWNLAQKLVKPRGTIVLKSTFHGQVAFNPAPLIVDEITLVGSRCGRFESALQLLQERKITPSRLLYKTLPLESAKEAFDLAQKPGILKVALAPASDFGQ